MPACEDVLPVSVQELLEEVCDSCPVGAGPELEKSDLTHLQNQISISVVINVAGVKRFGFRPPYSLKSH